MTASIDWGSTAAWVVEAEEREKGFGRVASGFPSSLDAKRIGQAEKSFEDPLTSRERSPADPLPSLWSA
jgi:hypothetical protein